MTTEHTDHPDHPDHNDPPEAPQCPQEAAATTVNPTIIIFNGLLVFQNDFDNKVCNVGVLRTRDASPPHYLQIEISPDPNTGTGTLRLDREALNKFVEDGHTKWTFDVVKNGLPVSTGVAVKDAIPAERQKIQNSNKDDFGWIINMESGEFHTGVVTRTKDQLKPIIKLTSGLLYTYCMANPVDVRQGQNNRSPFGYVAGAIGLKVMPTDGDFAVLYFTNDQGVPTEIFKLPNINEKPYTVKIQNTPLEGTAGGHFHMFYDRLFQGVGAGQKFDIVQHYPAIPVPNPGQACSSRKDPVPDPFKCGGVSVGSGGGSLE